MTFAQVADAYLESLEVRIMGADFRATTLRTYRNIIDHDLRPHFGAKNLAAITSGDVQDYRAQLVDRGLRPSTINQHRAVLSGVFRLAARRYSLPADPSKGFDRARTRTTGSGEIRFYTPEEVERLCAVAASPQDAAIYRTAAFRGCVCPSCAGCGGEQSTSIVRSYTSSGASPTRAATRCRSRGRSDQYRWLRRLRRRSTP